MQRSPIGLTIELQAPLDGATAPPRSQSAISDETFRCGSSDVDRLVEYLDASAWLSCLSFMIVFPVWVGGQGRATADSRAPRRFGAGQWRLYLQPVSWREVAHSRSSRGSGSGSGDQ